MATEQPAILPCPFCGGVGNVFPRTCNKDTPYDPSHRAFPIVRCSGCFAEAHGENWGKPPTAIAAWNRRALRAVEVPRPDSSPTPVAWRAKLNDRKPGQPYWTYYENDPTKILREGEVCEPLYTAPAASPNPDSVHSAAPGRTVPAALRTMTAVPGRTMAPEHLDRGPGFIKPDDGEHVYFYEQDFYVLSNFSAFNLKWQGHTFPTSEHAYHWEKFWQEGYGSAWPIALEIKDAPSAHEAFKIAERNKHRRRHGWDDVKVDIMRRILRAKVQQHEYVRHKLLETGDRELIEDSWRDDFWGWGPNRDGQNMLGKLWMEIRAELRAGDADAQQTPAASTVDRAAVPASSGPDDLDMRAAFWEWVEDRGCDSDGAWSAWQGCWNLLHSGRVASARTKQGEQQ